MSIISAIEYKEYECAQALGAIPCNKLAVFKKKKKMQHYNSWHHMVLKEVEF